MKNLKKKLQTDVIRKHSMYVNRKWKISGDLYWHAYAQIENKIIDRIGVQVCDNIIYKLDEKS